MCRFVRLLRVYLYVCMFVPSVVPLRLSTPPPPTPALPSLRTWVKSRENSCSVKVILPRCTSFMSRSGYMSGDYNPPRPPYPHSDLGDTQAIPIAVAGLHDKSKLVRWRAARVVGELAGREQDAMMLDEAREGELEFEVAFEMADAARKVRARAGDKGEGEAVAGVGPVWKQIQERGM